MNKNDIEKMLSEPDFFKNLKENKANKKEPITLYLDEETSQQLDQLTNVLNKNSEECITKSLIAQQAINEFASKINNTESMTRFIRGNASVDNLVIIFTSKSDNNLYVERFHGITSDGQLIQKRWSAISLGNETVKLINSGVIRFISIYRGVPIQACEEFGEIDRIEQINSDNLAKDDPTENQGDLGRYRIYIKGELYKLPRKVILGKAVASSLMRGRKTTLRNLLTKESIDQLS